MNLFWILVRSCGSSWLTLKISLKCKWLLFHAYTTVFWREEGYTMKYCLSPRDFLSRGGYLFPVRLILPGTLKRLRTILLEMDYCCKPSILPKMPDFAINIWFCWKCLILPHRPDFAKYSRFRTNPLIFLKHWTICTEPIFIFISL